MAIVHVSRMRSLWPGECLAFHSRALLYTNSWNPCIHLFQHEQKSWRTTAVPDLCYQQFALCASRSFRIFDALFVGRVEDLLRVGGRWVEWEGIANVTCLFHNHHRGGENVCG